MAEVLIVIPTYNERDNVARMCAELAATLPDSDVVFVDDNSPDGTGTVLDGLARRFPRMSVIHRPGKAGIGSAHQEGIAYAYAKGYRLLVTMDCDFTHSPADIPRLLRHAGEADVVVGSRYLQAGSLPNWALKRRLLTMLGHGLTKSLLGLSEDATGALRLYRLDRIRPDVFDLVQSKSYSFFFESLFILRENGYAITEIPIVLPARTYGHSKLTHTEAIKSARFMLGMFLRTVTRPGAFVAPPRDVPIRAALEDPQNWDAYWERQGAASGAVYELIANVYRRWVIKRTLNTFVDRYFAPGAELLHAGCGSGEVDVDLHRHMRITALDISPAALRRYLRNNPEAGRVQHGTLFSLPFPDASFDGIYNLGVVEHFTHDELRQIFSEFHRVLRPGRRIMLLWPHRWASSVLVLGLVHFLMRHVFRNTSRLHPPEVSLLEGRRQAEALLDSCRFRIKGYHFGVRDLFVQAVVVAERA